MFLFYLNLLLLWERPILIPLCYRGCKGVTTPLFLSCQTDGSTGWASVSPLQTHGIYSKTPPRVGWLADWPFAPLSHPPRLIHPSYRQPWTWPWRLPRSNLTQVFFGIDFFCSADSNQLKNPYYSFWYSAFRRERHAPLVSHCFKNRVWWKKPTSAYISSFFIIFFF